MLRVWLPALITSIHALTISDSLDFQHVANDFVHSLFTFTVQEEITSTNYGYFPRQIAHIVKKYDIDSFDVSVSRGHWRWAVDLSDRNLHQKKHILPAGGLLEATKSENKFNRKSWSDFTHELAGVTCSSFNRIDPTVTGWLNNGSTAFGQLPAEAVCTENLTPWLRLLTTSRSQDDGLVGFLKQNVYKLQESHYFGLTISVKIEDKGGENWKIKMTQTLSAVWKVDSGDDVVTLGEIFSDRKKRTNFALESTLVNGLPSEGLDFSLTAVPMPKLVQASSSGTQDVTIRRYLTPNGRGQLGGVINTEVQHSCDSESPEIQVHLVDVLPWCIAPFLSTFSYKSTSTNAELASMNWIGGKIRESPYQIEYVATIKRCGTLKTNFEYESKLLGWTNYPADAERGIFINPAIVSIIKHASSPNNNAVDTPPTDGEEERRQSSSPLRLYSIGLIIDVPKPDFSMPFNALCLACTAVAILFGNIHGVCAYSVEVASEKNEKFAVKLAKRLKQKVESIFKKKSKETTKVEEKPEITDKPNDKQD